MPHLGAHPENNTAHDSTNQSDHILYDLYASNLFKCASDYPLFVCVTVSHTTPNDSCFCFIILFNNFYSFIYFILILTIHQCTFNELSLFMFNIKE